MKRKKYKLTTVNDIYEFSSYGRYGETFESTQNKWSWFQFLMNLKRKTGHHLLASDGKPLIWKMFPEQYKKAKKLGDNEIT